ncbi:MAG: sulfate ABC transporter permease subunit CysW, partial [Gammaproteobacteria bacterium]|nr:sulfate ABC transporter permease subunit CysW [Gammaproteobacteria bacterium]
MSTLAIQTHASQTTRFEKNAATREPNWVKYLLLGISLSFFALFLLLPLIAVFTEALRKGLETYWLAFTDADALSAIALTLTAALISVPLNLVFGVAAAWAITKFEFRGKQILITF